MRISGLIRVFLIVLCSGLFSWSQSAEVGDRPVPVSLIRVIANPEKFADHKLRVIGVLDYGGGVDRAVCLYVSESDARNGVMSNCISIDKAFDQNDRRIGKYVILNATLRYKTFKDGMEFLSFDNVSDIRLWREQ